MLTYLGIVLAARLRDERGASAVEYGILAAGVAAVLVLTVLALGESVSVVFTHTTDNYCGDGLTPAESVAVCG